MPAISVRVAHRSAGRATGQRRHDLRIGRQPDYVDPARIAANSVILAPRPGGEMRRLAEERRAQRDPPPQRRMRSSAAVATVGIITYSADAQPIVEALDPAEQDRRIEATARRLGEEMGTELTGLVVHRDESAIHAHVQWSAILADGRPLAQTLGRRGTARLQDVAAEAWQDLGIERGVRRSARIAAGEDPSRWVHRSVRELHTDLPAELDAARAAVEQAQADAERQRELAGRAIRKAEQAESEGSAQAERLRERVEHYERRAADAEARIATRREELERLESAAPVPEPDATIQRAIPQPRVLGIWPREPVLEPVPVYRPETVRRLAQREHARRADAEHRADAERRRAAEAERRAEQEAQERQRQREAMARAMAEWAHVGPGDEAGPEIDPAEALAAELAIRYGVALQVAAERVSAPPQEATARQIAAALYRQAADMGWDHVTYTVPDAVAEHVLAMAREDGRMDRIRFADGDQQRRLEAEQAAELDPLGELDDPLAGLDDGPRSGPGDP